MHGSSSKIIFEEEIHMELMLLTSLLEAITKFLDEEEELGFLEQKSVDVITSVEGMLKELIFGIEYKQEPKQIQQTAQLMYVPFLDDFDEEYTHKPHREMEL